METAPSEITRMLERVNAGDPEAADELLPLIYKQLHGIAQHLMRGERADHTLQATALVNEAYMRMLGGSSSTTAENRAQFLRLAARAMRNALVDHARRRNALRRGGGGKREPLDDLVEQYEERAGDLVDLDEAVSELERSDEELAQIVELRFFTGLEHEQIATVLGISERTVYRRWSVARWWLRKRLGSEDKRPE